MKLLGSVNSIYRSSKPDDILEDILLATQISHQWTYQPSKLN